MSEVPVAQSPYLGWMQYSPNEIYRIKRKKCRKCPYRGSFSSSDGAGTTICCDYLLLTGQSRGCLPDVCTHHLDDFQRRENTFKSSFKPIPKEAT